jgi:hypothetical protein
MKMHVRVLLLAFFCVLVPTAWADTAAIEAKPDWLNKTIIDGDDYIFAVGVSRFFPTELEAKNDALGAATEAFVKYCRVDVQAFDRSMELYSRGPVKKEISQDASAQRIVRANAFVSKALPDNWYIETGTNTFKAYVLLKVPKAEFDRISKERAVTLSMDVLMYSEDTQGMLQVMDESSVLTSGSGYSIYVNPSDTCYLYVYQIDALGKAFKLFPNEEYETALNPIQPSVGIWLPNEKRLYSLDETTGKEFIYVFASPLPIREFEWKTYSGVTQEDLDKLIKLKKMGVAKLIDKRDPSKLPAKRSEDIREVKKKLQAEGVFVWETWFFHK